MRRITAELAELNSSRDPRRDGTAGSGLDDIDHQSYSIDSPYFATIGGRPNGAKRIGSPPIDDGYWTLRMVQRSEASR